MPRQKCSHRKMIKFVSFVFCALFLTCSVSFAAPKSQIILFGTGTTNPDPDRSGPAIAIVVNGATYLFDVGAGVVRRSESARKAGDTDLNLRKLKAVFLTHLHSDHTIGLPDLIFTTWEMDRKTPLELFGLKDTRAMIHDILAAYKR